ncbi:MAG TPA: type VI secretion system tube protein Hcp, partial [Burkholderiaceae bacterium]
LKITMTEVLVTSVSQGGSGGEDRLTENVTLNFASVKVDYVEQTPKGGTGDKPSMNWNIAENSKD